ncbi:MAG: hypothetical protein HZC36_11505 [Armatimonadetes bacterium]|nr:hypothetical protein [Armatimonadota bacterium]
MKNNSYGVASVPGSLRQQNAKRQSSTANGPLVLQKLRAVLEELKASTGKMVFTSVCFRNLFDLSNEAFVVAHDVRFACKDKIDTENPFTEVEITPWRYGEHGGRDLVFCTWEDVTGDWSGDIYYTEDEFLGFLEVGIVCCGYMVVSDGDPAHNVYVPVEMLDAIGADKGDELDFGPMVKFADQVMVSGSSGPCLILLDQDDQRFKYLQELSKKTAKDFPPEHFGISRDE